MLSSSYLKLSHARGIRNHLWGRSHANWWKRQDILRVLGQFCNVGSAEDLLSCTELSRGSTCTVTGYLGFLQEYVSVSEICIEVCEPVKAFKASDWRPWQPGKKDRKEDKSWSRQFLKSSVGIVSDCHSHLRAGSESARRIRAQFNNH